MTQDVLRPTLNEEDIPTRIARVMGQIEALTGVELKVLRIRKGLRQYDVAARLGIPPGRLSEIESGRREPSPELLGRILGVLGEGELPLPVDFPRERAQEP